MAAKDMIKVGVDVYGRIIVHARGNPATIVAVGAAAAIGATGAALAYGAYHGVRFVVEKRNARRAMPEERE